MKNVKIKGMPILTGATGTTSKDPENTWATYRKRTSTNYRKQPYLAQHTYFRKYYCTSSKTLSLEIALYVIHYIALRRYHRTALTLCNLGKWFVAGTKLQIPHMELINTYIRVKQKKSRHCPVIKRHTLKVEGKVEVKLHEFLISLDGGDQAASLQHTI